jgi:hypothetical protein
VSTVSLFAGLGTGMVLYGLACWFRDLRRSTHRADCHKTARAPLKRGPYPRPAGEPEDDGGWPEPYEPTAEDLAEYGSWAEDLAAAAKRADDWADQQAEAAAADDAWDEHRAMMKATEGTDGWYRDLVARAELGIRGDDAWRDGDV